MTTSWQRVPATLLLIAMTTACAATMAAHEPAASAAAPPTSVVPADLVGTTWRAETITGRPVMDDAASTLTFVSADRIAGLAACNRYSGPLRVADDGRLQAGPFAATRMMCPPALMDQEGRFLAALEGAERLATTPPFLLVFSAGAGEPSRLAPFTEPDRPPR